MKAKSSRLLRKASTAPRKPRLAKRVTFTVSRSTSSSTPVDPGSSWSLPRSASSSRLEISTRVSSQAQNNPTASPKLAVENPRRVNPFISVSSQMKNAATPSPPSRPVTMEMSMSPLVLSAIATPAASQTSR